MGIAGVLSGLLGIGSGAFKVLAMDRVMRLPYKVSTTTSNFMIGVTAAASAGIYVSRGYVDPGLAMPVVLGVLAGAALGTRVLATAQVGVLRAVLHGGDRHSRRGDDRAGPERSGLKMADRADERRSRAVGPLLRAGVMLAAAVVAAAPIPYLLAHGLERPDYSVFRGEPRILRSAAGIVRDALSGDSRGILQLGILILIATPVARVVLLLADFVSRPRRPLRRRHRDRPRRPGVQPVSGRDSSDPARTWQPAAVGAIMVASLRDVGRVEEFS